VTVPRTVRVTATGAGGAGVAQVLVLPAALELLDKVLGPGWLEPFQADLPFLDLETDRRFPGPGTVESWQAMGAPKWLRTGCGQPCRLTWNPPEGARAQLLSYREGDAVVRRDVTGLAAATLTPLDRLREVRVEALAGPCGHGAWKSWLQPFHVWVRGLLPFAGSPVSAGHEDGAGPSARFREPAGMAPLAAPGAWLLAVADPGDHAVRMVEPDGQVTTLCGDPGRPGHRDRPGPCAWDRWWGRFQGQGGPPAQFRGPTCLVSAGPGAGLFRKHDLIVADSGNHVLRGVTAAGGAATLAGCPGLAGHRDDDDPHRALFNDPRGLAVGVGGRVYVADRGNRVVRVVLSSGRVATLAGSPGQAGVRDGLGPEARFTDLKALAYVEAFPGGHHLLILDGHAVRALDPYTGAVTTVLGDVAAPGCQDVTDPDLSARRAAVAAPCLRDPADLFWFDRALLIADRGNHAIRRLDPAASMLTTLAGDPGRGEVRFGLLRDGLGTPLPPACATLDGPRGLARRPGPPGERVAVATGACVAILCDGATATDQRTVHLEAAGPVARNQPFVVRVRIAAVAEWIRDEDGPGQVTLECREADGSLGYAAGAEAPTGAWIGVPCRLAQPGQGQVVARYLSPAGVSAEARLALRVE
jgi:hypothetical protein